jgi:formylglycine-generating enzyme required for sulfatase activity
METLEYIDFDLQIDGSAGSYQARVLESPLGQVTGSFQQPFSPLEMENFFLKVGRPRQGVRRLDSPEMESAKAVGGRLFETVFGDEVYACFRASLNDARQAGKGLRVRLRVNAPELGDLPWEYLYNPRQNQFLSWSVYTPVVRYLEVAQPPEALAVKPPLRLLVMISSPQGYPPLDVEREWTQLQQALSPLEQAGLLKLRRTDDASLSALQSYLRQKEVHILHFIGHGRFDAEKKAGQLLFEDENGGGRPLSGEYLGALLGDHNPLRLVVLNACEGARTSQTDPYAGVAQSLVQQGIPAVIAMQFPITDQAAITFGREFYSALVDGFPVDAALSEARKAIFAQGSDIEWGTPVYFTRAPDGRIFDVEHLPEQNPSGPIDQTALTKLPDEVLKAVPPPQSLPPMGRPVEKAQAAPVQAVASPHAVSPASRSGNLRSLLADRKVQLGLGLVLASVGLLFVLGFLGVFKRGAGPVDTITLTAQNATLSGLVMVSPSPTHTPILPSETPTPAPSDTPVLSETPTTLADVASDTPESVPLDLTPSATHVTTLPLTFVDDIGTTMVLVPAGEFSMGGDAATALASCQALCPNCNCNLSNFTSEEPAHTVTLDAFYLDMFEVTHAQYRPCVEDGNCPEPVNPETGAVSSQFLDPAYDQHPVIYVTWAMADVFCRWRAARLPTEAEWEKAARGPEGRIFPWGNEFNGRLANYCDRNCSFGWADAGYNDGYVGTSPVGTYPGGVSPYGIYDLAGNVWEWVADWFSETYYANSPLVNPTGPFSGSQRVTRGGAWYNGGALLRGANRGAQDPTIANSYTGFRCARTP